MPQILLAALTLVAAALVLTLVLGLFRRLGFFRRVIVYEYQAGLKYRKGRYVATLGPGQYWIVPLSSAVHHVDLRPEFFTIQGQDLLSADGVTLKVSLAAEFQVVDPNLAVNKNANFRGSLYLILQMAAREIIGGENIDALLEGRAAIGARLMELASGRAAALGVKLISAEIKDIMLPGEMKKVFAQVVKARKEGQAALERARGETAALRNLANAARTVEDNPHLLQLRALQTLAETSGNTLVLGLNHSVPLTSRKGPEAATPSKQKEE